MKDETDSPIVDNEVAERRNEMLLNFLRKYLPANTIIRTLGDVNKPAVVINFEKILACYCKNFELRFLDTNDDGNVVFSIKLKKDVELSDDTIHSLRIWFETALHKKAYKVGLSPTKLFLTGWNYIDRENKEGRYPVFAEYEPKVCFTEKKAQEFADELINNNYNAVVV